MLYYSVISGFNNLILGKEKSSHYREDFSFPLKKNLQNIHLFIYSRAISLHLLMAGTTHDMTSESTEMTHTVASGEAHA